MGFWCNFWAAVRGVPNVCDKHDDEELDIADAVSDIQVDAAATRQAMNTAIRKLDQLSKDVQIMGAREDAAFTALSAKIDTVREGWAVLVASNASKDSRIAELESALADADANAAANLAVALDADSDADAAKVEGAAAALDDLIAPPVEPQPEPEGDNLPPAA